MCNLCFHYSIHGFKIGFVADKRVRAELWSLCMTCYQETTWRALLFFLLLQVSDAVTHIWKVIFNANLLLAMIIGVFNTAKNISGYFL